MSSRCSASTEARNVSGNATANYYFELNQVIQDDPADPNPVRTVGDIRIQSRRPGRTTSSPPWRSGTGTGWVATSDGDYEIAANSGGAITELADWWTGLNSSGGSIDSEGFIEVSLDLTSFDAVLGCPSSGFKALNGRSTTGNADKNLLDYFAAQPINIPSTCASLYINKFEAEERLRWPGRPSRSSRTRCPKALRTGPMTTF